MEKLAVALKVASELIDFFASEIKHETALTVENFSTNEIILGSI